VVFDILDEPIKKISSDDGKKNIQTGDTLDE